LSINNNTHTSALQLFFSESATNQLFKTINYQIKVKLG
jgi:hypothetical protein